MQKDIVYRILLIDSEEVIYARVYSDGEIETIWHDKSYVPNKQRCGGQSAPRFARARELALVLWYKEINEKMKEFESDIILGMNFVYAKKFMEKLDSYNLNKIKRQESIEYNGLTGIYQMINKLQKP